MDQPKIERLLRLMMLMTGNVNYTINDLADKLNTSYRSIYRYIDTFKAAGFVVQKNGEYFSLAKESGFFKDISQLIYFTDEEAFLVNKLIDGLSETNIIKENLRRKLSTIYNSTAIADCVIKKENAKNVHSLLEAIEEKKQAILKGYSSSHTGIVKDRAVEPYKFTTNYMYIWCFDLDDKKNKIFKTERIGTVEVLQKDWENESQHNSIPIDIFRISAAETFDVKLRLGIKAHNLILEEYPLSERDMTQISENQWILETKVCGMQGVGRFVLGLKEDIEIIEGDELKRYIKEYVNKYLS
ncbi:MAG: helix-turn-helix transcriptional regulator [Candidatus Egerieousia sp.]